MGLGTRLQPGRLEAIVVRKTVLRSEYQPISDETENLAHEAKKTGCFRSKKLARKKLERN